MKKSFSIIEVVVVLLLIAIVITLSIPKTSISKLQLATNKILIYLNYTRYTAMIDNKYSVDDNEWEKKRWTLKFQNCSNENDGLYFVVYSDQSGGTAHFKKKETLKDPLNNKYLYSGYDCIPNDNESPDILLTKKYEIVDVDISCNTTSTIGQISFGEDGQIYSQLGTNIKPITQPCSIKLIDSKNNYSTIIVEPNTGYIHKQ
jgi:type II secretory pathway pseudopilin PulG